MDKFGPWKYKGALEDDVLHVKPTERQPFQMAEVGMQTRYEFGAPKYYYLGCILMFLPRSLEIHLLVTDFPSSGLTHPPFLPRKEASFAFLVPTAKFCLLFLSCVI